MINAPIHMPTRGNHIGDVNIKINMPIVFILLLYTILYICQLPKLAGHTGIEPASTP